MLPEAQGQSMDLDWLVEEQKAVAEVGWDTGVTGLISSFDKRW